MHSRVKGERELYMNERLFALFGVVGPLIAYIFIGISIALAPWFSWWRNALSDLGHALSSESAAYYNFGLALTGLFILIYSITIFRKHAKYTSLFLAATAFALQLVAVFDEVYGRLHMGISVLFFVLLILSCLIYAIEARSVLGALSFVIGLGSWLLYYANFYEVGVAVPEIISSSAAISWVTLSATKIYLAHSTQKN